MGQRMSNSVQGALSDDLQLSEQAAILNDIVLRALRELEETAGRDQQITSVGVELDDSVQSMSGQNMLRLQFSAEVRTRLR